MKILVTGCRGYIGLPLMCELENEYDVIGVDNNGRQNWTNRIVGKKEWKNEEYIYGDLADQDFVNEILAIHKPDVIIHLASQPSMPYSQISGERALFTQINNISMGVNLLWGIKENGLKTKFITTTTTGIPGQYYKKVPENTTVNMAGSWYHVSRGYDSTNLRLACSQWGFTGIEFRTSIVYGLRTLALDKRGVTTRFDTDFYFGTVLNRFVKQAIDGKPITIYGRGLQTKPFISLEDTVQSLVRAIRYKFPKGHTILNQTTEMVSILDLAKLVNKFTGCKIKHIPNPRKENETHQMSFGNSKFLKVLGQKPIKIEEEIGRMIIHLKSIDSTTWSYVDEG